jgi:hypothetical protein
MSAFRLTTDELRRKVSGVEDDGDLNGVWRTVDALRLRQ